MRLLQSGPEQDAAGEPIEKLVRESDDLEVLKAAGLEIAKQYGTTDVLWTGARLARTAASKSCRNTAI